MIRPFDNNGVLNYQQICSLIDDGVVVASKDFVGPDSLDVHLDGIFYVEDTPKMKTIVRPAIGDGPAMAKREKSILLQPGEFCLASIRETVHLPDWLCIEFRLRSTAARCGLNQAMATWGDAGWHGNLTLELVNTLRFHKMRLAAGDRIGQIIFKQHDPSDKPYTGVYNNNYSTRAAVRH